MEGRQREMCQQATVPAGANGESEHRGRAGVAAVLMAETLQEMTLVYAFMANVTREAAVQGHRREPTPGGYNKRGANKKKKLIE